MARLSKYCESHCYIGHHFMYLFTSHMSVQGLQDSKGVLLVISNEQLLVGTDNNVHVLTLSLNLFDSRGWMTAKRASKKGPAL